MATSKVLKPRRGSTAEHATFKGQAFEITFDTDKKTVVAHDGLTMGGFPLAHEASVIETDAALRTLIDQKVSEVEGVSSSELRALESALRGLINSNAQQQVTKDTDQDNVIAALDSTLRALIAQEVAKCLKTSGGTMTGAIYKAQGDLLVGLRDDVYYGIYGCTDINKGARIILSGKDCPGWNGEIQLEANNGTNKNILRILPDGRTLVAGSPVLTSAGGTLYAPLKFYDLGSAYYDGSAASESMNVGLVEENVGRSAILSLRTQRASDAPGSFWLGARNATAANYLTGTTDGWLGWRGYDVLTSAHGLLMNGSNVAVGTVSGNTFTLPAGGTWAYTYHRTTHGDNAGGSGVAAGGATITTAEGPTTYFAIRIA